MLNFGDRVGLCQLTDGEDQRFTLRVKLWLALAQLPPPTELIIVTDGLNLRMIEEPPLPVRFLLVEASPECIMFCRLCIAKSGGSVIAFANGIEVPQTRDMLAPLFTRMQV